MKHIQFDRIMSRIIRLGVGVSLIEETEMLDTMAPIFCDQTTLLNILCVAMIMKNSNSRSHHFNFYVIGNRVVHVLLQDNNVFFIFLSYI